MGRKNNNTKASKWKQLSEQERYQIEILIQSGYAPKEIGRKLKRDRRTIEREIRRGTIEQRDGQWRKRIIYCADVGRRVHNERGKNKGQQLKIGNDHKLAEYIEKKIKDNEYLFSGRLEIDFINEKYHLGIPEGEYETLAGYVFIRNENIPEEKDIIYIDNFEITIVSATDNRIETLQLKKLPKYDD